MGYTTEFEGRIEISPPLDRKTIAFLTAFANSRRMDYYDGPYTTDEAKPVRDYNCPPQGQPSLWCNWEPTPDGTAIVWNGAEKFYKSAEWMTYIIDHFLAPSSYTLNGVIDAEGEDRNDVWRLVVTDNVVTTIKRPTPAW
jgi:hypothetical protein